MQHNYIADQLMKMSDLLKCYDSVELVAIAMTLTNIGAEIRKHAPRGATLAADGRKPEPRKVDPNSMIPRPVTPPRGSGPVKLRVN